jgi:hypothetical protein
VSKLDRLETIGGTLVHTIECDKRPPVGTRQLFIQRYISFAGSARNPSARAGSKKSTALTYHAALDKLGLHS